MSDVWIVFAIIAVVIGLFVWDRLPVIVVCIGCALALWATGVLTLNQSLAGFGDPATVFVTSLFVASAALEKTGITAWAGQILIRGAGSSRWRLIVLMMLFFGVLSAVISVNGAVAALLPVVVVLAVRLKRPPSHLLMPLVFGGHAGSMLALTGTPVNVLVLEASLDAGRNGFGYFEYRLVGIPLLIGTILIAVVTGGRLLPVRESRALPPDLSRHARTLVEQFRLDAGVHQLRVRAASPLVGLAALRPRLRRPRADHRHRARRGSEGEVRLGQIGAGDLLLVRGEPEAVAALAIDFDLALRDEADVGPIEQTLFNRESGLAEVLVPPRSPLIGDRLFPGMVTPSGDLVVLAVQRQGADLSRGQAAGGGRHAAAAGHLERARPAPGAARGAGRQLARPGAAAGAADGAGGGADAGGAGGDGGAAGDRGGAGGDRRAAGGRRGAAARGAVGRRNLPGDQLDDGDPRRGDDAAVDGDHRDRRGQAACRRADRVVGAAGPRALLAGLFVLTAVLGQVISNTATALIIIPISVVAAAEMVVSPQPVLMAVAVAAAAAFLTPVATPTNLMVMEPAGYRFGDYWKFGLPMMLWFFVVAVGLVPVIWPF